MYSSVSATHRRFMLAVIPVLLLSLAQQTFADPLSFNDALALALRSTPTLAANAAQENAARAAAIPAGELPDPKLAVAIDNLPINTSDRFSLSRDSMTARRIGIMQEFPNQDKRAARAALAQGQVAMAEAQTQITRLTVLRETALAWIARDTVEQQLARIEALLAENRLLDVAVRARLAGGKGMASEVIAPRQEAAEIAERREVLQARREQAIAALKRWIGPMAQMPLQGRAPDWPIVHETLVHGLQHHPELAAFVSKESVLNAEVAEAQAEKKSDWAMEFSYQQRGPQYSDMVSLQVSFDLRLFSAKRQDPKIAAKRAERMGLDAEREAALREHVALLETDLAEYQRLTQAMQRQRELLLPLADEKLNLVMADWRGNKGGLTDVIAARRERIDAELKLIQLSGERSQVAARLHYAYTEQAGEKP